MTPPAPKVSVVIPARDAAPTLEATLDSLAAQTLSSWEAIVVDDGSRDATRKLAERRAADDGRIHVMSHAPSGGVSAARNRGIGEARADALLFLDADDLLTPEALELLHAALEDPRVDAVHSGWARMTEDGALGQPAYAPALPDLFARSARSCPFPIHACLVRRAVVERAAGFDEDFAVCEDWDLWQRIARAGAHFAQIRRPLALYRLRIGSASLDPARYLEHARRVIATGHSTDARVEHPDPRHADGAPAWERHGATLVIAAWVAGIAIGRGEPAGGILASLPDEPPSQLSPEDLADVLFTSVPAGQGRGERAWPELIAGTLPAVEEVAAQLERHAGSTGLGRRVLRRFERLVVDRGGLRGPAVLGGTWVDHWDLERPPPARAAGSCERIALGLEVAGERVADLHLPLLEAGLAPDPGILADALADATVWDLLGRHFAYAVLPALTIDEGPNGARVRRGSVLLADGLAAEDLEPRRLHDVVGWAVFLQEIWGRPGWGPERFEERRPLTSREATVAASGGEVRVLELADELPEALRCAGDVELEVRVGGVSLAIVPVTTQASRPLTDAGVIAAVTAATGFELCRAVVREAVLGRPLAEPGSLRERLRDACAARAVVPPASGPARHDTRRAPGWQQAVSRAVRLDTPTLVLGRREGGIGGAAWRRAALPAAALEDLRTAAEARGESWELVPAGSAARAGVYAPDALGLVVAPSDGAGPAPDATATRPAPEPGPRNPSPLGGTTPFLRSAFEQLFASGADPWRYESAYERRKYEHTLDVIGGRRVGRALEVGCAEGHFTVALASRADAVVAVDLSSIALERARARSEAAGVDGIQYLRLDVQADPLPGAFDLVVASEVLYYLADRDALAGVLAKLAAALRPGGRLVCAHPNLLVDDPDRTGFDWDVPYGSRVIGEALAAVPGLEAEVELRTPLYRVQAARRPRRIELPRRARATPRVIEAEAVGPDPDVAARLRVGGGEVAPSSDAVARTSPTVPILMYHHVAASGPEALARWRTDPEALEEQLDYLHGAGYVTLDLETWGAHLAARTPAPERAVVLTFDDAYADLPEHVLPLLRERGFTATVFVATDHVGATSAWDAHVGTPTRIMDWDALAELAAAGMTVASHAASHRPLTALSHHDVVLEALSSRAALEERLGRPVTAIAYPYGDEDAVVRHLVGAAGLQMGLTCEHRRSHLRDEPLALPRIEIEGTDRLEDLVRKLG